MRKAPRARSTSPGWIATRTLTALLMIMQQLTPTSGILAAPLNQTGRWVGSPSLTFSATHTVVMREPGSNATKVFLFGEAATNQRMKLWRFFPGDTNIVLPTTTSVLSSLDSLPHPIGVSSDLFCSGHATLPDGRMTLIGGTWLPPAPCRQNYTLDPAWRFGISPEPSPWTASAQMATERWYATATPMSDGKVLISAGTSASRMIGFGGLAQGVTMDTTWRVLQPLELSAHFSWADTTAAPGDTCTVTCQPLRYKDLHQPDFYTYGRYPPGRESHVFVGDHSGRAVLYGGRRRLANGDYEVLNDIWSLSASKADDDTTYTWNLMEQVPDPVAGLPKARWACAATWAGIEDRSDTQLLETTGPICFIQGGKDSLGQVLGDLWRGVRRLVSPTHYQWVWTRLLAGDATTQRFGHTMMFDPGPPGFPGAALAKLLVYGGWKTDTELADPSKVYAVGVGDQSTQPGVWRTLTPTGTAPPARAWQAMTPRWKFFGQGERRYYLFGGESGTTSSTASPVAPDLWQLKRPDVLPTDEDSFTWSLVVTGAGPSGRSRPALAFHSEGNLLVTIGGDTTGSAAAGGQSGAIWAIYIGYGQTGGFSWSQPYVRSLHAGPPPIAGMGLIALGDGSARIARSLEQFNSTANSGAAAECGPLFGQWQTVTDPVPESERVISDYPNIFLLPDGRLFNAGPAPSVDPGNARSHYKRFFNLQTKRWEEGLGANDQQDVEFFGSAVMYRPGKILRAGSTVGTGNGHTQTIDIGAGQTPPWAAYLDSTGGVPNAGKPALKPRTHHNVTILPTGDVLATGGVLDDGHVNSDPVKNPQIWSVSNGRWNDPLTTAGHTEWLAPDPYIRNYHSTAVLLPDARVLTGGGEEPSPYSDQTTASIFEPPYLFRSDDSYAPRPRVQNGPDLMPYGRCFTLRLYDSLRTSSIRSIAILRPGATTHSFDQGQRYVPLNFVARESPKRILIQAPTNGNLAPPGDYMLFVVDSVGADAPAVPSVARWVRVAATTAATTDTGDVIAPRGGDVINLHDAGACTDDPSSPVLRLAWMAPADDDTIAFSGSAKAYNLRYALNASPPPDFNNWTPWSTGPPAAPFASEQVGVYGLSANTWYRFALKTSDDNANSSSSSNVAIVKPSMGHRCRRSWPPSGQAARRRRPHRCRRDSRCTRTCRTHSRMARASNSICRVVAPRGSRCLMLKDGACGRMSADMNLAATR